MRDRPQSLASALPHTMAIIIVTFQNAAGIAACLHSLNRAFSERRLHLFLIDNSSADGTREVIAQTRQALSSARFHIEVISNRENVGFTRAVNQGLERYVAMAGHANVPLLFLNPDTILPPQALSTLLEKLYALPQTGVMAPQLIHPEGRVQPSCRRFPTHWDLLCELTGLSRLLPHSPRFNRWKMGNFDHRTAAEVEQPQGAVLLARPEVIQQVGLWDERFPIFFSDVDWCKRVWERGWKIRFEPSVQIVHAQGVSVRQVRAAAIWSSHVSFWRYLRKYKNSWWENWVNLILGPLLLLAAGVRMAPYLINVLIGNAAQKKVREKSSAEFRA